MVQQTACLEWLPWSEDPEEAGALDVEKLKQEGEVARQSSEDLPSSVSLELETSSGTTPVGMNLDRGFPFETADFRGQVLFLHRCDKGRYAKHFEDKLRNFEVRIQGVFKRAPGNVFIAGQLPQRVGLSFAMNITANWLLSVAKMVSAARGIWFTANLEEREVDGSVAHPYYAIPVYAANHISRTPAGQTPPPITQMVLDVPLDVRKQLARELNVEDTYTFAFWDKYVDFKQWMLCNMPFGYTSSLEPFIGNMAVHISMYRLHIDDVAEETEEAREAKQLAIEHDFHVESRKDYFVRLIVRHSHGASRRSRRCFPSCFSGCFFWRRRSVAKRRRGGRA